MYLFYNSPVFQVFLEDPFLIRPFCTVLCQFYILLPFLYGFYTLDYIENESGFIIKDWREFLGLNKSPAHLMVDQKWQERNKITIW